MLFSNDVFGKGLRLIRSKVTKKKTKGQVLGETMCRVWGMMCAIFLLTKPFVRHEAAEKPRKDRKLSPDKTQESRFSGVEKRDFVVCLE